MSLNMVCALTWTIITILNIIAYKLGRDASWMSIFVADILIVFMYWNNVIQENKHE